MDKLVRISLARDTGHVARIGGHNTDSLGFIQWGEFADFVRNYQLLSKNSAAWS